MLKRALQAAITFGLLTAAYAGYVRGFELVALRLTQSVEPDEPSLWHNSSKTRKEMREYAIKVYGPGHWTTLEDTQGYYDAERGFWMYFRDFERINDGRQIDLRPFAVIWGTQDGGGLKTAISESARIDLDQPLNVALRPGAAALHVVHAKLENDVRIRDDKGTADPSDDLRIGPLTSIEYDEPTLRITSDSEVVLDDRDFHLTGIGLVIQLRPRDDNDPGETSSAGFNGAQTVIVKRNVFVTVSDVGNDGILPSPAGADQKAKGKTPIELRCALEMRLDLPKPKAKVKTGPPAPAGPTLAHFRRNVEVLRGVRGVPQDQLHCDNLHLTLVPGVKNEVDGVEIDDDQLAVAEEAGLAVEPESNKGPLTELTLQSALATGHNVQLVSAANGLKARCNEMTHKKQLPFAPDETYLRGEQSTKVIVEKTDIAVDGPDKGKVTSYTHIKTVDAKIFDQGQGNDASTIVARGPGQMESHPNPEKPVERRARWNDQLTLQNINVDEKVNPDDPKSPTVTSVRKLITLTGQPQFEEVAAKTTLKAQGTLVLRLKPKGPVEPGDAQAIGQATAVASSTLANPVKDETANAKEKEKEKQAFEIDSLIALDDVYLISPAKQLHARNRLDALFSPDPAIVRAAATIPTATEPSKPVAAAKAKPVPKAVAPSQSTSGKEEPKGTAPPAATPGVPEEERPPEPSATAIADRVWARIYLKPKPPEPRKTEGSGGAAVEVIATSTPTGTETPKPAGGLAGFGGNQTAEIDKVYLRGDVIFHQDPEAGKTVGTNISGQAIDVVHQGKDLHKFVVFAVDPNPLPIRKTSATLKSDQVGGGIAAKGLGKKGGAPVPKALDQALEKLRPLAKVQTDDMTIDGDIITLDQLANIANVDGPGSLKTMTNPGLLTEKSAANEAEEDRDPNAFNLAQVRDVDEDLDPEIVRVELADRPLPQVTDDDGRANSLIIKGTGPAAKYSGAVAANPGRFVKPAKPPMPLTITWQQGMKFIGNSTDPQGRRVAVAEFYDHVHAFTEESDIKCDDVMRTYMDKTVQLVAEKPAPRPRRAPVDPNDEAAVEAEAEARAKAQAEAAAAKKPKADLAVIECVENVFVENRKYDETSKLIVQKQRIRGSYLIYQKSTGKFRVPGAGIVDLYEREKPKVPNKPNANSSAIKLGRLENGRERASADGKIVRVRNPQYPNPTPPLPRLSETPVIGHGTAGGNLNVLSPDRARIKGAEAAAKTKGAKPSAVLPLTPPAPPLMLTTVKFKREMIGRFGTGENADKSEMRWSDFFGDVESIRANVETPDDVLDPDSPPDGAQFLTAQVLRVVSEPVPNDPKGPPRYTLWAWENAFALVDDRTIQADTITFNSKDEQFFAYGLEGREVMIVQQSQLGQPGSTTGGRAAMYNHKTGYAQIVDASKVAIVDGKTGVRPSPEGPIDPKLKPVKPKRSIFRNPRMGTERKDFKGS